MKEAVPSHVENPYEDTPSSKDKGASSQNENMQSPFVETPDLVTTTPEKKVVVEEINDPNSGPLTPLLKEQVQKGF